MFDRLAKELWDKCPIEEFSHFVELDGVEAKIIGEGWAHPVVGGNAIDRLAAYEDSGLSPEQVQELAKAKAEGRLVEVVRCKDCDRGYVDKDMSSPDRGWWYGCKDHKNYFKRADGYCSMGVPREDAEKAIGGKEDV